LAGPNALAYFASSSVTDKKVLWNFHLEFVETEEKKIEQENVIIPSDEVKNIIQTNCFLNFYHAPKLAHKQLA
jgi:hypothetical protein